MGAHVARLVRTPSISFVLLYFTVGIILSYFAVMSKADSDSDALLKFKDAIANNSFSLTSWNSSTSPCNENTANWIGVLCYGGTIWGLQLEGMGLNGSINVESLASMRYLRTISLMNNHFQGSMPEINKLSGLKSLFLSNNRLSGVIPDDAFLGLSNLKKVFLANNGFSGPIPSSLATLPRLLEVRLNGNQFQGRIPDFQQADLKLASFSNNDLEGPIPQSLSSMDPTSFAGNKDLCGPPLDPCESISDPIVNSPPPSTPPANNAAPLLLRVAIIAIVLGLILALIALALFIFQWRKRKSEAEYYEASVMEGSTRKLPSMNRQTDQSCHKLAPEVAGHSRRRDDAGKLCFVQDDIEKFDLQDMLRASAEVLGSGTFGASYKAVIMSGQTLVVKRYKQMNTVGREDFHEHMRRLGNLKHPNVLPLVAYYYRREEKLLITEFVHNNSLANHLHANHSLDQPGLDWTTRLKIIKGVVRGVAYLYSELPSLTIPHGHLKSSNVLLDENLEAVLTDYALRPVMNSDHARSIMTAYKSPEYAQTGSISRKTEIWCLGILILELLTGKFPENYLTQGYDSNASLASWVSSMVKEKRTSEVFDVEMRGTKHSKGEMINLLKIGLSCCEEDEERRIGLKDVVEKIEQLRESTVDADDQDQFSATETDQPYLYASRVIEDDVSFSLNR